MTVINESETDAHDVYIDVPPYSTWYKDKGDWWWHLVQAGLLPTDLQVTMFGYKPEATSRNLGVWHGQRDCPKRYGRVGKVARTVDEVLSSVISPGASYMLCDCTQAAALVWVSLEVCGHAHTVADLDQCTNVRSLKVTSKALDWLVSTDNTGRDRIYHKTLDALAHPPRDKELHPALAQRCERRLALRRQMCDAKANDRGTQIHFMSEVSAAITKLGDPDKLTEILKHLDIASLAISKDRVNADRGTISYREDWGQVAQQWCDAAKQYKEAESVDMLTDWDQVDVIRAESGLPAIEDRYLAGARIRIHQQVWETLTQHSVWVWCDLTGHRKASPVMVFNLENDSSAPVWRIPLSAALLRLVDVKGVYEDLRAWSVLVSRLSDSYGVGDYNKGVSLIGYDERFTAAAIELANKVGGNIAEKVRSDGHTQTGFADLIVAAGATHS